jgi:molybdopterin converting factor small subunit
MVKNIKMISVTVKIHYGFKKFLPHGMTGDPFNVSLENNTTLTQLLEDKIRFPGEIPTLILINGLHVDKEQRLKDGDRVSIFSPMAGG